MLFRSQLTANAKDRLDALVKHAQMNGNVDEIQVAVWSDNPAPRHDEQLSKDDRTLADLRGSEIAKYVKRHGNAKVVVYNMAERSSWLAKAFDTADAELKYEIGHDYKTMSKQEFQIFRDNGKPSKAVVLVVMKR